MTSTYIDCLQYHNHSFIFVRIEILTKLLFVDSLNSSVRGLKLTKMLCSLVVEICGLSQEGLMHICTPSLRHNTLMTGQKFPVLGGLVQHGGNSDDQRVSLRVMNKADSCRE